jgi:hypothetical protein
MINQPKLKKIYSLALKIIIIIISYAFIYKQVFYKKDLVDIYFLFKNLFNTPVFLFLLVVVFLLMFVNWGIESWKWHYLIKKIETVPFFKAFKAVLSGVTVSTFTPNRVGEFFGRVFILEKANHWEGIFITVIGSISQLLITLVMGLISILCFIPKYINYQEYFSEYIYYGFVLLTIAFIVLLLFLFFNISLLTSLVNKFNRNENSKIKKYTRVFSIYSKVELLKILILSFIRYCVFSIQFYLLFILFKINIPFIEGIMMISLIFFILTAIPTIALSELGIRGSVAIYILGLYFEKLNIINPDINIAIIASSSTLWLINLAIPSLVGSLFVFNLKFFRKKV